MTLASVRALTLTALVTGVSVAADLQPMYEVDDGRVLDRTATFVGAPLDFGAIRDIAYRFAREMRAERRIYRLTIADSAATLADYLRHSSPDAYPKVNDQYPGSVAQVFGLDGNAILSFRKGKELRQEILLGGSNPTLLNESGIEYRLLNFKLTKLGPGSIKQPEYALDVFVMSSSLISARSVAELTRRFAELTRASGVSVRVRPDFWFVHDRSYPDLVPFVETGRVPTEEEYELRPTLTCGTDRKRLTCSGQVFVP